MKDDGVLRGSPASTSPPIIILALPIPVLTMEQYWAWLLTISFSRFSIYSRDVAAHGEGMRDNVSNLYPQESVSCYGSLRGRVGIGNTPIAHHLLRRLARS